MSAKPQNPFIVIESNDAGGGSTQTALLSKALKRRGYAVLSHHFPQHDQPTGQVVYEKFLKTKNAPGLNRREQALLYIQDFFSGAPVIQQHLAQSKKAAVVSDRFYGSTLAYQTIGLTGKKRRAMLTWISNLCEGKPPALPRPHLVILLDLPVAISLKHLKQRHRDYFENKAKLTAIRRSYIRLAKEQKWTIINSVDVQGQQRSKEDIHQEIWSLVAPFVSK